MRSFPEGLPCAPPPSDRRRIPRRPRVVESSMSTNAQVAVHGCDVKSTQRRRHRCRRRPSRTSAASPITLCLVVLLLSTASERHHHSAHANAWGRPGRHMFLSRPNRGGGDDGQAAGAEASSRKLPPPPPPRVERSVSEDEKERGSAAVQTTIDERGPPPPPPPPSDGSASNENRQIRIHPPPPPPPQPSYSQMQEDPPYGAGGWYAPEEQEEGPLPPMPPYMDESSSWIPMDPRMYPPNQQAQQQVYDLQQQQQQQPQEYYERQDPNGMDQFPYHEAVVEELVREREMLQQQANNLTESLREVEQREALRVRQIDLLTERMMESDAEHARGQLLLAECQSNCTHLQLQVNQLMQDLENQKKQQEELEAQSGRDAERITALKKELETSQLKAEELAFMIERHRIRSLVENGEDEDDEDSVYRGRRSSKKAKKKVGFWAWLFGWGSNDDDDSSSDNGQDLDDVYTTARSTLLSALQSERNSVHELETIVASLQQNNSAISEQVKSRDQVIDELNDRILVFEEDKLVLKAALKQLQKDLSAEAPKTQKLVQDLEAAQTELKRLKKEIKGLIRTHQEEVAALRETISVKEDSIAMTESNLTVIGTYVDRLESRLAEFALARRDIEVREAKCREIELIAEGVEKARDELQAKVKEMESEHDELRILLRELADERAKLLSKNQDLEGEIKTLKAHDARVQESLAKLNSDYGELVVADMALQHKLDKYEKEAVESNGEANTLKEKLASSERQVEELRQQVESEKSQQQAVKDLLQQADATSKQMKERLDQLQALNNELSANNTRIQKEANETASSRRPASVSRDVLSIHLANVTSQAHRHGGVVRGSSVRDLVPVLLASHRTRAQPKETPSPDELRPELLSTNASKPVALPSLQRPRDSNASTVERSSPTRIQIPTLPDKSQPAVVPAKPFRTVRKAFAKATGMHGAFTKDYKNQSTTPLQALRNRIPTRGSAPDPRRIAHELVQNPLRRSPHPPGVPPVRQGNRTKDPLVRIDDAAMTASHNATAKKSEPPSSLLKPGLPAFGRKEGASVPPGRREARADSASPSAVPVPPHQPPPPPVPPKVGATEERLPAAATLASPETKASGTPEPRGEKRPDDGSSSRASNAGPRQPLSPKSSQPEQPKPKQGQRPPREAGQASPPQQQQQQQQQQQPPPQQPGAGSRPPSAGGRPLPQQHTVSIQNPPTEREEATAADPRSPDTKS